MAAPTPKEIREAFADYRSEWKEIYDEGQTDLRYILGDPWDPEDRKAREDSGRPCLSLDELNQYLNQYVNNLREANRAVQVMPKGDGANDQDAENRANLIRGIEDESNAQGAYITAGECAAQQSIGFSVIRTDYKDDSSFDQTISIQRIANPETVLLNPCYKQVDASDVSDGFLLDLITKIQHKEKYGEKTKIKDFADAQMTDSSVSTWVREKYVQVAEYWKVEHEYKTLLLVQPPPTGEAGTPAPVILTKEEWEASGKIGKVLRDRRVAKPKVMQYMTNGLEILDTVEWAGTRIPIIGCFGKEIWTNNNGVAKRNLLSMVRLARDPQMLFAFLATQECEEAGMVPKVPFVGAKGQFESDADVWEEINKVPHAYVQYDIILDGANGESLPPPSRPQYVANFQQYELAKDSARRSIQAAFGIVPLPTAAQRASQKSGVALDKIETQEQVGSYHFSDNHKRYLHNMGWQLNELITPILDTTRDAQIRRADGTRGTLQLVGKTSHPIDEETGAYSVQGLPEAHLHTGKGSFGVTVSDGPSFQSEREQQSDFVDHLIENWQTLAIPPAIANKVLAKAIRMKNLGAVGTDIAMLLDPPDPSKLTPEAQAIVAQLQSQLQAAQTELEALHLDRAGRVLEQQTKKEIEAMKAQNSQALAMIERITKVIVAQLAAKSRSTDAVAQQDADRELALLGFHRDHLLQGGQQAHELAMRETAPLPDPAATSLTPAPAAP